MAHFIFKSKKSGGEVHKGEQDAKDRFELYKMLKESGEEVISAEEKKSTKLSMDISLPFLNSVRMNDKIKFTRNLGSMIKAGLSMSQSLSVMERQETNKAVKKIITALNADVRRGKTLSEGMGTFPKMFSPMMIAMVRSGEESGTLAEALRIITLQMDKSHGLQRRVKGALIYPGIIFCAMIGIGIILFTYVVPTLTKTFKELKLELPASTRFIMFISELIQNHGIVVFASLFVILASLYIWSKQEGGKKVFHKIVLKIPIIGNLAKEVNVAHTARTLSSLIDSGVDVLDSLGITADILQNVYYKKIAQTAVKTVERGEPLSKIFSENTDLYPVFFSEMIHVGEETGKIGEMLLGVAVYYEEDVDQKTKDMATVIEPFLMIIIAGGVAFFAIAMISPMYSLVNAI